MPLKAAPLLFEPENGVLAIFYACANSADSFLIYVLLKHAFEYRKRFA
jgi:hypothetical protein